MRYRLAVALCILTACSAGSSVNGFNGESGVPAAVNGVPRNPSPAARDPNIHANADVAVQQLMLQFWTNGQFSNGWGFAQALDVVVDNVQRTHGRAYGGDIDTVFNGIALHGYSEFGTIYYDDENWLALSLVRAYRLAADQPALAGNANAWLQEALRRYAIVQSGEVFDANGNTQGVWWSSGKGGMASASNAPSSLTASLLYETTGDPNYLAMGKRLYDHWYNVAVDHNTYQVADGVQQDGSAPNFAWQFTYNYGGMIGAALELHKITGDSKYLTDARGYAAYELDHLYSMVDGQKILDDGCHTTCTGDGAEFKGIGYRYLVALAQMDPNNATVQSVLNNSAASIFANAYDTTTGSFFTEWAGPANPNASFASETAASMAVGTLGTTALTQGQRAYDADTYEAEEAYSNGPVLQASQGSYSGWGYVATWGSDGQSVTFTVNIPADGNYNLTWRYAADGDGSRNLTIPAEKINANVAFPSTNGFGTFTTVSTPVFLHAGTRPVTLTFSTAAGSKGMVNLDRLRVDAAPQNTTCTAPTAPTLVAPVQDAGSCGSVQFEWTSMNEPSHYAVMMDQNIVCTVPGGTHSCTVDLSVTAPGRHNWSVRATNDCTTTASDVGEFNGAAAMVAPLQNVHWADDALTWSAPPATQNAQVDVLLNGQLVCSQLLASQCILPTSGLAAGQNSAVAVVHNVCGQLAAPAATF